MKFTLVLAQDFGDTAPSLCLLPHNSGETTTFLKIQNSHGNVDLQNHLFTHLYFNDSFRVRVCLNRLILSEIIFLLILVFPLTISVSLADLSPP